MPTHAPKRSTAPSHVGPPRRLRAPHRVLAAAALTGLLLTLNMPSSQAAASESLGGVSIQGACDRQYPGQGLTARVTGWGTSTAAYSWVCSGAGVQRGIDIAAQCAHQYGYGAGAGLTSVADAYGWYCRWNITTQMRNAADWAIAEKNSPLPAWSDFLRAPWSGACEVFAEQATGFPARFPTALAHYRWQYANGRIHTDRTPPFGAMVFWDGGGGAGHVAVSIGGGQVVGTRGMPGQRLPVGQYPVTGYLTNSYLGWAYPIGS